MESGRSTVNIVVAFLALIWSFSIRLGFSVVSEQLSVKYIGYIENGRKSWLIFTKQELDNRFFAKPNKLKGSRNSTNPYYYQPYWKSLAISTDVYLKLIEISECSHSLNKFV
jgi:hypothetical protein